MKQYRAVLKVTALLIVLGLAGPSFAAAACGLLCASRHDVSAHAASGQEPAGCHEHAGGQPEGPVLAAGADCHDLAATATLIAPSVPQATPHPTVGRIPLDGTAAGGRRRLLAAASPPVLHDPPLRLTPLRI